MLRCVVCYVMYRRFRGTCCPHQNENRFCSICVPWHWRQVYFETSMLLYQTTRRHVPEGMFKVLRRPTNNLPPTVSSPYSCVSTGHQDSYREWRYHMLLVYNYVLLKVSTWCSKHVEESNILQINNSQCIKLVINV